MAAASGEGLTEPIEYFPVSTSADSRLMLTDLELSNTHPVKRKVQSVNTAVGFPQQNERLSKPLPNVNHPED